MKAPDKLYLWETPIVNGGYDPAWHKNSFYEGDVEYIRKDALLEWAEDFKANTGWYEAEVAMDDLIDKLNTI